MNIILASTSPRRKEILSKLKLPFKVDHGDIVEPKYTPDISPLNYCKGLSKIKNTGKILPGHGGLLDRVDGIIFVVAFAYFLFKLI